MRWLDSFCNTHKGVRRTAVFSAIGMLWFIAGIVALHPTDLSTSASGVMAALITACGTLIGLYERSRAKEDKANATN